MANIVRDLPPLKTFTSSGGTASLSVGIGNLDDAGSITIFPTSSATASLAGALIQVSQFDPAIAAQTGVSQSTGWNSLSTTIVITSSSVSVTITNVSFRGLRLSNFITTSSQAGEVVAFVSKQISV